MLCANVCALGNFEPTADGKAQAAEKLACFECGHCVAVCPMDAITHTELDQTKFEPVDEAARPDGEEFLKFLKSRRSRREFMDEPVPAEVIEKLLEAASHAPSSLNTQSVEYTVITNRAVISDIATESRAFYVNMRSLLKNTGGKLLVRAMAGGAYDGMSRVFPLVDLVADSDTDVVLYNAPCVILIHGRKTDIYAQSDAIFNAGNILLAAETLGLGACVIGLVTEPMNRDKGLKSLARIPASHKVLCTITLGYPKFKYKRTVPKKPPKVHYVG